MAASHNSPHHPASLPRGLNLLNLSYVKRWVVAPVVREQSVAEHTFRVLIIYIHLNSMLLRNVTTADINHVIEHDREEIWEGDVPGPKKSKETGYLKPITEMTMAERLLKIADSIETGTFWVHWGMPHVWNHEYNQAPDRDIAKIIHYAGPDTELLDVADVTWAMITGQRMQNCLNQSLKSPIL